MNEFIKLLNDYSAILSLLFSIIAIGIAYLSYKHARKRSKDEIRNLITSKQTELKIINQHYFNPITSKQGCPEKRQMEIKKHILEKGIEQLEKLQ